MSKEERIFRIFLASIPFVIMCWMIPAGLGGWGWMILLMALVWPTND